MSSSAAAAAAALPSSMPTILSPNRKNFVNNLHHHQAPTSPTNQLTILTHGNGLPEQSDEPEDQLMHPNREQLHRRDAIVPEEQPSESDRENNGESVPSDCNLIIVPHLQVTADNESPHLYNRAISGGGGLLADLQRATLASQHFYAENGGAECSQGKTRSPWILRRLYEWSHRAKSREMLKHVHAALDSTSNGACSSAEAGDEEEQLAKLLSLQWDQMFSWSAPDLGERDKRRLKAVWELFHSELVFLIRQLLVLRNVYKEPLKKCQVEGCLLGVEPELLFGNLDQLCRISRRFCQSFLSLLEEIKNTGNSPTAFETTELVVQLFKRFAKGPSTISAYQAYCINYKATIEYLGSVRQKEERFVDFERVCLNDPRCVRLQLDDLLIAPLQRITRLPILLREILRHTESPDEINRLEKVLEQMNENLRSIDDSVQWLHNFERLQQLQHQIVWPSVAELEPKSYIPDFLKGALARQFCENLLAHPRRRLVHEGHLEYIENGRTSDCYCFLFNDMFLITKVKKVTVKSKKNASSLSKQEFFIVQRQPVPLDSCVFCDTESELDTQQNGVALKNAFVVIHLTRYYQVLNIYTCTTLNKREKEIWIEKFQESIENYESIQLKDMLRCTPLYSSLSMRRASSSRSHSTGGIGSSSPSSPTGIGNSVNGTGSQELNQVSVSRQSLM